MENLSKQILNETEKINMWEMSNIRQKYTGLPMVIWMIAKTGKEKHGPRLKVQTNHSQKFNIENTVSVTIEDEPKVAGNSLNSDDLKLVKDFIKKNKKILLKHWKGEADTGDLLNGIVKVNS